MASLGVRAALLLLVGLGLGLYLPTWLLFMLTMALANGLVSLGIVLLMRGGVVAFGQGLMSALGGYAAALMYQHAGVTDGVLLPLLGGLVAMLMTAPVAPLLARYRGIFFSMLTLALSMVGYGILVKTDSLGGSDGFNMGRVTLLGQSLADAQVGYVLFAITLGFAVVAGLAARIYMVSTRGLVMALGHIDPNFSYWTTSGEFVFVAILAGSQSVVAVMLSSAVLEVVRSFSSAYFPTTWQFALGLFLLLVIRFLPQGLGSLWQTKTPPAEGRP